MISIIIPAFNAAKTIEACLASVFQQTLRDFEVIIVNDGSTDETVKLIELVKKLNSWSIVLINQNNQGANAARQRGRQSAKGDYLLFCDADIVLRPDCLEKMLQALEEHPGASYAYASFRFGWKKFKLWPFSAERLRQMPYIHTTSLIRREHFPAIGWDESIKKLQDWDLWLTMLEEGRTGVWAPEILFQIVSTKGTMSHWLPSFFYHLPWKIFGYKLKLVADYEKAVALIKQKHHLS